MYRKQFLTGFLLLLFTWLNIYTNAQTLTPEQIFKRVDKSVVVVLSLDDDNDIVSQGSGVVFDNKGLVATNFHVIGDGTQLAIKHYDKIIEDVEVVGFDAQKDILILKIPENFIPSIKIADVSKLQPGQRIYAVGSPLGLENTISEGIISGLRYVDDLGREYIQITASVSSGSSGGAVVNSSGDLVGISTATLRGGQNLNFAIKISEFTDIKIGTKTSVEIDYGNLFSRGIKAAESGDYVNAIKIYTEYLIKNPNDEEAYFNRGFAKVCLGDYRGAINDYTKAIEINQQHEMAYTNRGITNSNIGNYRDAIQDFTKAIQINPENASAYIDRGFARGKIGDEQGAIQDFKKATDINPNNASIYLLRGIAKSRLENYRGAIQDYNKAIEINPNDAWIYLLRGNAKYNLNDKNGACLDWSKAGELGDMDAYDLIKEYCR